MDKKKQERDFLLFIPIPVFITVCILFSIFGGGSGSDVIASEQPLQMLSVDVPKDDDGLIGEMVDKFTSYQEEEKNERDYRTQKQKDPYKEFIQENEERLDDLGKTSRKYLKQPDELSFGAKGQAQQLEEEFIEKEKELEDKLSELEKSLNGNRAAKGQSYSSQSKSLKGSRPEQLFNDPQTPVASTSYPTNNLSSGRIPSDQLSPEIQAQLASYESAASEMEDQEASQFSDMKDMLDKILDIQHPERVKQRLKEQSGKDIGTFHSVHNAKNHMPVDYLGENEEDVYVERYHQYMNLNEDTVYKVVPRNMVSGFMGLSSDEGTILKDEVKAVVHKGGTVTSGSKVKLRLLSDIVVSGREVRSNSYIYGVCEINGSRVDIEIASIQVSNAVIPVNMMVYDHDGMEGIYVNGLAEGQDARQAATNAGTQLNLQMADPSIRGRLIDNSVREVRQLLQRKAQAPKAFLKSGHQLFLLNAKN